MQCNASALLLALQLRQLQRYALYSAEWGCVSRPLNYSSITQVGAHSQTTASRRALDTTDWQHTPHTWHVPLIPNLAVVAAVSSQCTARAEERYCTDLLETGPTNLLTEHSAGRHVHCTPGLAAD